MSYQDRKDIDRIYDELFDGSKLLVVSFKKDSDLRILGSLDDIFDYYDLKNLNNRVTALENTINNGE